MTKIYQSGDIILFSEKSYYFSRLIEWWTRSEYSHVGMILVDPTYLHPSLKGIFVWESGWQSFPDADDESKCTFGVRLTRFDDYISKYNGSIQIRSINKPLTNEHIETLKYLYQKYQHKPYDTDWFDWVKVAFHIKAGYNYQTDRFFCSAWVMFVLCKLGLVTTSIHPWDLCKPCDLSSNKLTDKDMNNGYSYSKEDILC